MSERTADADQKTDDPMTLLDLPHGKGLKASETAAITRRALTSVVLFAGTADCGKTTLLATLHLLFQRGPFAGYNFAGSDTLVGFEDRVSLARTASGRTTATRFSTAPAPPASSARSTIHGRSTYSRHTRTWATARATFRSPSASQNASFHSPCIRT